MKKLLLLLGALLLLGTSNASAWYWCIKGESNGWSNTANMVEYASGSAGTATIKIDKLEGNFLLVKFGNSNGGDEKEWIKKPSLFTVDPSSVKVSNVGTANDSDLKLSQPLYNVTITLNLTVWGESLTSAKIVGSTSPAPNYPSTMYVLGQVNEGDWAPNNVVQMTVKSEGVYTATLDLGSKTTAGDAMFSFTEKKGSSSSDWDSISSSRYGSTVKDQQEALANNGVNSVGTGQNAFKVPNGNYTLTLDFTKSPYTLTTVQNSVVTEFVPVEDAWKIQGQMMNSGWDDTMVLSKTDKENIWTLTTKINVPSGEFLVKRVNNSTTYFKNGNNDQTLQHTNPVVKFAEETGANLKFELDTNIEYTFTWDSNALTLTISGDFSTDPEPEGPARVFIRNTWTNNFDADENWEMTYNEETDSYYFIATGDKKIPHNQGFKFGDADFKNINFGMANGWNAVGINENVFTVSDLAYNEKNFEINTTDFEGIIYFKIKGDKSATATFTKDFDNLWIYGQINDSGWDEKNNIKMTRVEPGIFVAETADLYGSWNKYDQDVLHKGKEFDSTNGENYIAFFDNEWKDRSKMGNRYGAAEKNVEINPTKKGVTSQTEPALYTDAENNFKVADEGIYKVTYNLRNWTATFEKITDRKVNLEYAWYDGEGSSIGGDDNTHGFTYGDGQNDWIQVGADNSPTHRTARQAEFTVMYREPNYTAKANIRARANELDEVEEQIEYYKSQGYRIASEEEEYNVDGSSNYGENHLIQLNQAGDYAIIAKLSNDAEKCEAWNVIGSTLEVSVAQKAVKANLGDVDEQPFDTEGNMISLEKILSFNDDYEGLEYGKDFTIRVEPATSGWKTYPETAANEAAAYESVLTSGLYGQYNTLVSQKDYTVAIDGFYRPITTENIKVAPNKDNEYTATILFPCSGVYNLIVEPAETNVNYDITPATKQVTITPNFGGKFGNFGGLAVTGYSFNEEYKIYYDLTDYKWTNDLINEAIFLPGTYFTSEVVVNGQKFVEGLPVKDDANSDPGVIDGPGFMKPRRVNTTADGEEINNVANIDLSKLLSYKTDGEVVEVPMEVTVTKNGASSTQKFTVVSAMGPVENPSTGVEGVEATDEAEAVYYNLQGVRVENPEHGIYVKVVGGKAEKVVL